MLTRIFIVGIFLVCALRGAGAATINFDFEEGQNFVLGHGPVPVGLHSSDGFEISFSNASYSDFSSFAKDYPGTLSGKIAIIQYVGVGPYLPIVASFNAPASTVSVRVLGVANSPNSPITSTLTAYGAAGELLASTSFTNTSLVFSTILSVSAPDIRSVQFSGQRFAPFGSAGTTAAFDDLSVTPVPLPGSALLHFTVLGFLGLIWWRTARRHTTAMHTLTPAAAAGASGSR
jgi:hypothetical protein